MQKSTFFCLLLVSAIVCAAALDGAWTQRQLSPAAVNSEYPDIAVSGANIYTVWREDTPGNWEIYFRRSTDNGVTWQGRQRLTFTAGESCAPAIAARNANVYVVWNDDDSGDDEIYFLKSTDSGATWRPVQKLTTTSYESVEPDIAVSGTNIYVVWEEWPGSQGEIYFRKSTNSGATWNAAQRLTNNLGESRVPAIAANGGNVYVASQDPTSGDCEIYFKRSIDGGSTWGASKRLTYTWGISGFPDVAAGGDDVFLAWMDVKPGNKEIYFKKSTDGGATWGSAKRITYNTGYSVYPDIAVNGANVYLVWGDNSLGSFDIYFRKSANGGTSWQTAQQITSYGSSIYSAVAVNATYVYAVWHHTVDTHTVIYLKYSPL